ncbi:MAG TPA: carbohydrate ABC transporter permease, partial [Terrimesophilobacter sp.]|nr:carbohydrate ABC transporter permease [Terrimesophilobacter sp.]
MTGLTLVRPKRGVGGRIADFFGKSVVNVVLIIVAVFWLVPTIGLFLSSLRSSTDNSESGWWTVFTTPAQLTIDNYANLLGNSQFMGSFVNTIAITLPATALVVIIGALAGYAFAWIRFPGRDWLLVVVIVLLAVPLQVSLIPIAKLYGSIGLFGSIVGVIIFHVAYGLPFAIFL